MQYESLSNAKRRWGASNLGEIEMRLTAVAKQAFRFLMSTFAGLGLDLLVYALLVWAGLVPALANVLSSAAAVVLMYFLSSRFTFQRGGGPIVVVLFFGWYVVSITLISWLVQLGVDDFALNPLVSKLCSLPISFVMNFAATRTIFHYYGRTKSEVPA